MNNRLGCFSATSIIIAFITALIISVVAFSSGSSMFSPGKLNGMPGEQLGGVLSHALIGKQCAKCHAAFWEKDRMSDRCVVCHTAITQQLINPLALHGILYKSEPATECRDCHPDHRGATAPLTALKSNFPHKGLGFSLAAHPGITCVDCHIVKYSQFDALTCTSCHDKRDNAFMTTHVASYGSDCLGCHDGVESISAKFDHTQTKFPLTGLHQGLICTKCHLNARSAVDFQNTSTECINCHAKVEPHGGRFGTACETCHNTSGWKPAKFDHNLASFKLTGKHVEVACEACHLNGVLKGTPSTCGDCHQKDDAHQGELGADCGLCHSTNAWKPSIFDHNLSAFKLTGAHLNADCNQCHQNAVFKGTPSACYACHAKDDSHGGRFGTDCGICHSTTAWKPATFDHNMSAFKLTGAHANLACERCHSKGFSGTPSACAACHGDPTFHRGMFGSNCGQCHNTSNWSASYNWPHPTFGDQGGINHGGASCRDCHTKNLGSATCLKCHDSNNPGDGGGGDDRGG